MKFEFFVSSEGEIIYHFNNQEVKNSKELIYKAEVKGDVLSFFVNPRYHEEIIGYERGLLPYSLNNDAKCMIHGLFYPFFSLFKHLDGYNNPAFSARSVFHNDKEHQGLHLNTIDIAPEHGGMHYHFHLKYKKNITYPFFQTIISASTNINKYAHKKDYLCSGNSLQLFDPIAVKNGMKALSKNLSAVNNNHMLVIGEPVRPKELPRDLVEFYDNKGMTYDLALLHAFYDTKAAQNLRKSIVIDSVKTKDFNRNTSSTNSNASHRDNFSTAAIALAILALFYLATSMHKNSYLSSSHSSLFHKSNHSKTNAHAKIIEKIQQRQNSDNNRPR